MTHNDCHLRPPFYCESVAKRRLRECKISSAPNIICIRNSGLRDKIQEGI